MGQKREGAAESKGTFSTGSFLVIVHGQLVTSVEGDDKERNPLSLLLPPLSPSHKHKTLK